MQSADFVLYCLGASSVFVAAATSIRIVLGLKKTNPTIGQQMPRREPVSDPAADALLDRLQSFQDTRFSSPIVQRRLDIEQGPRPSRLSPYAENMRRSRQTPSRPAPNAPFPRPHLVKRERKEAVVVRLPVKPKNEEPPKEGA